ncbi:MAG: hypothetical protein Q9180_008383, partial [Flavoplaca navasiana]
MVVKFYTFGRVTAKASMAEAHWLRGLVDEHVSICDSPTPNAACHPAYHDLMRKVLRPKWVEKMTSHYRILNVIWEALGPFNDEDAAQRAADDAAEDDEEGKDDTTSDDSTEDQ